jgi:peroxiredoxin Q/BCP
MKMTALKMILRVSLAFMVFGSSAMAGSLLDKPAPQFTAKNQDGVEFSLSSRLGQGYTVLFFYPKAGTPGCTKQACAFRDSVKVIRDKGAVVYGISADDVAAQKKFHDEQKMTFDLLSDADATIIKSYQVKMPVISMAKRQTFILDDKLIIRRHFEDVDPALDAKNVAKAIEELKAQSSPQKVAPAASPEAAPTPKPKKK